MPIKQVFSLMKGGGEEEGWGDEGKDEAKIIFPSFKSILLLNYAEFRRFLSHLVKIYLFAEKFFTKGFDIY